jgi:hypothetical protein
VIPLHPAPQFYERPVAEVSGFGCQASSRNAARSHFSHLFQQSVGTALIERLPELLRLLDSRPVLNDHGQSGARSLQENRIESLHSGTSRSIPLIYARAKLNAGDGNSPML